MFFVLEEWEQGYDRPGIPDLPEGFGGIPTQPFLG